MGDREAQEFWNEMWNWEKYETYPGEDQDDPHLVIALGFQVESITASGQVPSPELLQRFDHCVGRVMHRLNTLMPRTGEQVDTDEFGRWLSFGLDPSNRGHDAAVTPIIDSNDLSIFRRFVQHAVDFCVEHQLDELEQLWTQVGQVAQEIDDASQDVSRPSRFQPATS